MCKVATVTWGANGHGYVVQSHSAAGKCIDEYRAGNNRYDSTAYLPLGDPDSVELPELRDMAELTATDIAHEAGLTAQSVSEDPDLKAQLDEHFNVKESE